MYVSIVVPLYNEEDSVEPLYTALKSALQTLPYDHEILFIDDGSRDATVGKARHLAAGDKALRVIRLRKNYGQTPAMAAGIDHARGDIVVTMDGDLQNDPRDIGELVRHLEDYDIAVGWRFNRQDKLLSRKVPSRIANWIIGWITGVPIKDNGCSLKAYRASVIKKVPLYSDMHRFIPAMASLAGARVVEIKVQHHARQFGRSKYGLNRIFKVLFDLMAIKTIVSFASRPLVWFAVLALPSLILSIAALAASMAPLISGGGTISGPLAGTGVLFGALTVFLIFNGALAELVYRTGDVNLSMMGRLTMEVSEHNEGDGQTDAPAAG
jgi:glycosyltransferase involved in cell wall biosynthesis